MNELNHPVLAQLLRASFLWGQGDRNAIYSLPQEWRAVLHQSGIPMKDHKGALLAPDLDRVIEADR